MASQQLKRHQAVIWLPPRSAGEAVLSSGRPVFYAQIGGDDESERRLVSLEALEGVRQVWLIADARDVALITAPVPPLSGKRLKQALPNVIEEYVLQDPARCLIVPGPVLSDGQRVIGVIDAHWVDAVLAAFKTAGIRVEALWPGQLVLPWEEGKWTVLVSDDNLTVRTGEWAGTGWAAGESESAHRETASALLSGKLMGPPPPRVNVWLGQQEWRSPMKVAAIPSDTRLDFTSVPPIRNAPLDLLAARNAGLKTMLSRIDWRLWKGVGVLAGAVLAALVVGINLQWLQMRAEASGLQDAIRARFHDAFPNAAMVDPVLQMRRNINDLRLKSGRPGPDDFVPLLARFAQAVGERGPGTIEALEFREGTMKIRFVDEVGTNDTMREALVQDAARLGLSLTFDNPRDPTARLTPQGGR